MKLNKNSFDAKYGIECRLKESNSIFIARLDFKLEKKSDKEYGFEISSEQFLQDLDGSIEIVRNPEVNQGTPPVLPAVGSGTVNRVLQLNDQEIGPIVDSEGMDVDLSGLRSDLKFSRSEYEQLKSIEKVSDALDSVTGNFAAQIAIMLASMSPVMFSFSASVMNRVVYFRSLKTDIPMNLHGFFKITGSGWSIKAGESDLKKNANEMPEKGFFDKLYGIELEDQSPPFKFQDMKMTDIYLKSCLPIFLLNFFIYLLALIIIAVNKCIKNSEIDRIRNLASLKADEGASKLQMSRWKYTLSKTFEAAELHFRWNGVIRGNLLVYQNFTLGLFLNVIKGWDSNARPILKISYIFSWLSLVLVFFNGYIFYHIVERYTNLKKTNSDNSNKVKPAGPGPSSGVKVYASNGIRAS